MKFDSTLSRVVLPEPVPPDTTMFRRLTTQARRNSAIWSVIEPKRIRSETSSFFFENLRMVTVGPSIEQGGMIAFTREPSGRRASTIGHLRSMRRPSGRMMRSITFSTWSSFAKRIGVWLTLPRCSTYTTFGPFTITSETDSSRSSGSIGPKPNSSSVTIS